MTSEAKDAKKVLLDKIVEVAERVRTEEPFSAANVLESLSRAYRHVEGGDQPGGFASRD